jgi:glycyl-tRNA synthetase beta chain
MATLLLELFSEEIPSRMQQNAASQLSQLLFKQFQLALNTPADPMGSRNITPKLFVSPRHLAISITGLPLIQPDYAEERRGPKIGAPEQALKGFLTATGLTIDQCEQRDGYYYANIERKGRSMADVAKELVEYALVNFNWPKSMHWGSRDARPLAWVRPLHNIVALLDEQIIPAQFGHLTASNITHGHRFLAPAEIKIPHAEQYESLMLAANVMVDFAARRAKIAAEIAALAAAAKLQLVEDENLLNEVTGLVEWPVPLLCQFDAKFLDLPPEVLISEMKNHQRYFALTDAAGKLTNQFITVANMVNADGGARVKDGNARVVRARLADGEFYWEQDRKVSLEDWGKKLSDVVFHAEVGMMNEKVSRIVWLSILIGKLLNQNDLHTIARAALLSKADLTSGMVGEFPELQGIMGRYYAIAQKEKPEIADTIRDHYKPVGANDSIPKSPTSAIVSIADKLDSIACLFAVDAKPTGSKDPYALRRAALGLLKICIGNEYDTDLTAIIRSAAFFASNATSAIELELDKKWVVEEHSDELLRGEISFPDFGKISAEDMNTILDSSTNEIILFLRDRLNTMLKDGGVRHDVIEAGASSNSFNPFALKKAANDLAVWLATPAGTTTLAAIKRALNILAAEEKKEKKSFAANAAGAESPAEKAIATALATLDSRLRGNDRKPALLEALTAPINQFFTDHLVNEDGKRDARLSLLAAVREAAFTIADFSKIEG